MQHTPRAGIDRVANLPLLLLSVVVGYCTCTRSTVCFHWEGVGGGGVFEPTRLLGKRADYFLVRLALRCVLGFVRVYVEEVCLSLLACLSEGRLIFKRFSGFRLALRCVFAVGLVRAGFVCCGREQRRKKQEKPEHRTRAITANTKP